MDFVILNCIFCKFFERLSCKEVCLLVMKLPYLNIGESIFLSFSLPLFLSFFAAEIRTVKLRGLLLQSFLYFTVLTPVAVYPLNAEYGAKDVSSNDLPKGTVSGIKLAEGPNGEPGGSYYFTGNFLRGSFVEFQNHRLLDTRYSISIVAWIYLIDDGPLFDYGSGVELWFSNSKIHWQVAERSTLNKLTACLSGALNLRTWYYLGVQYNYQKGTLKAYINGKSKEIIATKIEIATNYSVRMGIRSGDNRHFKGRVSCLQVYKNTLGLYDILATRDTRCFGKMKGKNSFPAFV